MFGWLLRGLLILLVIRAVMLLVGGVLRGVMQAARLPDDEPAGRPRTGSRQSQGTLVQDPVCGTYVLQDRALTAAGAAGPVFFCSERCRSAYDPRATAAR